MVRPRQTETTALRFLRGPGGGRLEPDEAELARHWEAERVRAGDVGGSARRHAEARWHEAVARTRVGMFLNDPGELSARRR